MKDNSREKKVEQMFAQNPDINKVHVTADGFGFTAATRADSHAQSLKDKTVEVFTRDQFFPTEDAPVGDNELAKLSVPKLVKAIAEVNDIEALHAAKDAEEAKGENARKTAVEAIQARIDELTAQLEVEE